MFVGSLVNFFNQENPPSNANCQPCWKNAQKKYFFDAWSENQYASYHFDTEPDLFSFNFCGYSGQFSFDEDGIPVLTPYQNIQIGAPFGPNPTTWGGEPAWIFITPNGMKYIFLNTDEFTEQTSIQHLLSQAPTSEYTSTWYLSKIKDPTGGEIIFSYEKDYENADYSVTDARQIEPARINGTPVDIYKDCAGDNCAIPINADAIINTKNKKEIVSISCEDIGVIEFVKSRSYRYDLPFVGHDGFHPLGAVQLKNNHDQLIKKIKLAHSYFGSGDPLSWPQSTVYKHLRLDSLTIVSIDNSTDQSRSYLFNYENFPSISEAAGNRIYYQDIWGFFNGTRLHTLPANPDPCNYTNFGCGRNGDNSLILRESFSDGALRDPDENSTKGGILKEIISPLGGKTTYEYELNQYYNSVAASNKNWGGLRIKRITESADRFDSENAMIRNFSYVDSTGKSSGEIRPLRAFNDTVKYYNLSGNYSTYRLRYSSPNREGPRDLIRYTHVEEIQSGNGKIAYEFSGYSTNPDDNIERKKFDYNQSNQWSTYTLDKSNDAGAPLSDRSYQRGLLKKQTIYQENPSPSTTSWSDYRIQETIYQYSELTPYQTTNEITACRINCEQKLYKPGSNLFHVHSYNVELYKTFSSFQYLSKEITKIYDLNSSNVPDQNSFVTDSTWYYYSILHCQLSAVHKFNSDGIRYVTSYKYPKDYQIGSTGSDAETYALYTLKANHIDNVITEKVVSRIKNDTAWVTSADLTKFGLYGDRAQRYGGLIYFPRQFWKLDLEIPISDFEGSDVDYGVFTNDSRYSLRSSMYYDSNGNLINSDKPFERMNSFQVLTSTGTAIATFQNAIYSPEEIGDECSFCSFEYTEEEDNDFWSGTIVNNGRCGDYAAKIDANNSIYGPTKDFIPEHQNQKYKLSCWVKTTAGYQNNNGHLIIHTWSNPANHGQVYPDPNASGVDGKSWVSFPFGDTEGEWKYVEVVIDLPFLSDYAISHSVSQPLGVRCYLIGQDQNSSQYILVDDIRFQPEVSLVSSFTYNEQKLISSSSNQNSIPEYYGYDGLGRSKYTLNQSKEILKEYTYYDPIYSNPEIKAWVRRTQLDGNSTNTTAQCSAAEFSEALYTIPANTYHSTNPKDIINAVNAELNSQQAKTFANNNAPPNPGTAPNWSQYRWVIDPSGTSGHFEEGNLTLACCIHSESDCIINNYYLFSSDNTRSCVFEASGIVGGECNCPITTCPPSSLPTPFTIPAHPPLNYYYCTDWKTARRIRALKKPVDIGSIGDLDNLPSSDIIVSTEYFEGQH